jgi:hypothetical protein
MAIDTPSRLPAFFRTLVIADCNLGPAYKKQARVMDHHGIYPDVDHTNATMQMLNSMEDAIGSTQGQVERAMRHLDIQSVTTDNLGDGAWSVWCAQNQRRVLGSAALRNLIREATHFEDYAAFGGDYDRSAPGVELQAAIFLMYGNLLESYGIRGGDRITELAPADQGMLMHMAMNAITQMVDVPDIRRAAAQQFWHELDQAIELVPSAEMFRRTIVDGSEIAFYDLSVVQQFSIFQQWLAFPAAERNTPLQVTVNPVRTIDGAVDTADTHNVMIAAIPFGRRLPGGFDPLTLVPFVNADEQGLAGDRPAAPWFGRPGLILPLPTMGSRIAPTDLANTLVTAIDAMAISD